MGLTDKHLAYGDDIPETEKDYYWKTNYQQPCDDCISREAVLDIIMPYCQDDDGSVGNTGDLRNALDDIESLPPVTPKEKTGYWIYKNLKGQFCSACDKQSVWKFNYCPNCGLKMVEPQQSEDEE